MTGEQRIAKLEAERARRVADVEELKRRLAVAEDHFRRTRVDGTAVLELGDQIKLARMALVGVEDELAAARAPRKIYLAYSHHDDVQGAIDRVKARRDWRRKTRREQEEAIRAGMRGQPESHVATAIRNAFCTTERQYRVVEEQDARELEYLEEQLAELERRTNSGPTAA